jgi:hypothetical protein
MLTIDDCIALSDLTEQEIDAIAEHEHVPEMVAVEMGCCLVHCADGQRRIASFIRDDIDRARRRGNVRHAADLTAVLRGFVAQHEVLYGAGNHAT